MLTFKHSIMCGEVRVMFSAKPDERIRNMLKAAGFRWSPGAGLWWRRRIDGAADFLAALEKHCNPGRPDGACWRCKSPQGFFRPRGAATPVWCETCYQAVLAQEAGDRAALDVDRLYEDQCRQTCGL